jgi:hypothetical protein
MVAYNYNKDEEFAEREKKRTQDEIDFLRQRLDEHKQ